MKELHVGTDPNCEYKTIGEALEQVNLTKEQSTVEQTIIYIKPGVYKEKLVLSSSDVTMIGESPENTVITYGDYAKMVDQEGDKLGTLERLHSVLMQIILQ